MDGTFWHGTLDENNVEYDSKNHEIVIELSHRGIMNSICLRNEYHRVRDILTESGIWECFIFPSIDWSAKAERIIEIIEVVQLRPETVLFVDDNPANRAQAQAAVPGIQVVDPSEIEGFLLDPGFAGKVDPELTRLKQYKVLELRHAEMRNAGVNSIAFLRQSEIVVSIIYDIERHIDRAVELINR